MSKLDPYIKNIWISALRSGKYQQGRGTLRTPDSSHHCCLGVLCEVLASAPLISREIREKAQYHLCAEYSSLDQGFEVLLGNPAAIPNNNLASLNDDGVPFEEIARLIEEHK
jgi:hypothetical protein